MGNYAQTIAGKQPDDTQGIATVELFKTGNGDPIKLVGCVIHLSKKDKSLRNILKVDEEKNKKVKYFIFVPSLHSSRPTENITKIEVKLHRYRRSKCIYEIICIFDRKGKEIELEVDHNDISKNLKKYEKDNYFVIPYCAQRNFQISYFLKKWSSELLLHNNPSQVSQISSSLFHGFKKEANETLFKYCGFEEEFNKLEDQGVLLIRQSIDESYVIGCYKKENGNIKKYCFLLKGLEEINSPSPDQPLSGSGEGGRNNPPQDQPPSGSSEGGRNNPPQDQPHSGSSEEERNNPPQDQPPSGSSEEERNNPPQDQPPSGSSEEERNNPPQDQPPSGSGEGGRNNPPQDQPPSGSGEGGRNNPPQDQPPYGSGEGGRNNPPQDQPPYGSGEEERNNPPQDQPPSGSGEGGRNNPTPDQHPSSGSEEVRDNPSLEHSPSTAVLGSQVNPEQSQESVDGQIGSSELAAPRRQSSLHGSREDEVALKIKKRQLILNTYGPGLDMLPHDVMHKVCLMLNRIQKVKGNDYRKIADKIGLEYYEIQSLLENKNPMEEVFHVMISRTIKVNEFIDILFKIERDDVVQKMYEMALEKQSQ